MKWCSQPLQRAISAISGGDHLIKELDLWQGTRKGSQIQNGIHMWPSEIIKSSNQTETLFFVGSGIFQYYIYTSIYIHICIYIYIYAYMHIHIYMHICIYIYKGVYVYIYICVHIDGFFEVISIVGYPKKNCEGWQMWSELEVTWLVSSLVDRYLFGSMVSCCVTVPIFSQAKNILAVPAKVHSKEHPYWLDDAAHLKPHQCRSCSTGSSMFPSNPKDFDWCLHVQNHKRTASPSHVDPTHRSAAFPPPIHLPTAQYCNVASCRDYMAPSRSRFHVSNPLGFCDHPRLMGLKYMIQSLIVVLLLVKKGSPLLLPSTIQWIWENMCISHSSDFNSPICCYSIPAIVAAKVDLCKNRLPQNPLVSPPSQK